MNTHHPRPIEVPPVTRAGSTPPAALTEATVALNIASHREELLRINPQAISLAASCVFAFHESITGSLTTALKSRSGRSYGREQGVGLRALTVEDIAELATAGGVEGRRAVIALLAPIMDCLEGGPASGLILSEAVADYAREATDVSQALMRGKTDTDILRELNESDERAKVLRNVLQVRRNVTRKFAEITAQSGGAQ